MPTVQIKLPDRKVPSRNLVSKQVFPTEESPISITYNRTHTQVTKGVVEIGK